MVALVPPDQIEQLVGARRHPTQHRGCAASTDQTMYVLHSGECKDSGIDLRDCQFSKALGWGIDPADWPEDEPVVLALNNVGALTYTTETVGDRL